MIAFDTNILIYACDRSEPTRQAQALDLLCETLDGVLLWQVACEFVAATRKLAGQGFTQADAWHRLNELLDLYPLLLPSDSALRQAQGLHLDRGLAFWDAMIVASCIDGGVQRLYSEDLPAQPILGLEILNPFAK